MEKFNLSDLEERFNQLGEDVSRFVSKIVKEPRSDDGFRPETDVFISDGNQIILIDLPGMSKSEIRLSVKNSTLIVSGERKPEMSENYEWIRTERSFGRFSRSFSISENVNSADIKASFRQGVLKIVIPKNDSVQSSEEIEIE
jgi:HSP20 family protein